MINFTAEQTTVLTPHPRLSRWLLLQHANRQKNAGIKLWATPEILPLNAWLKKRWIESWPQQFILSNLQVKRTWEQIIKADKELPRMHLLHLRGAADQASRAFALIKEYRIPTNPDLFKVATEFEVFLRWMSEYEHRLSEWGALDPAQVLDSVKIGMAEGRIPLPDNLVLAGFAEITPQLKHWLDFLKGKNVPILFWPETNEVKPPGNHKTEIRRYEDQTDETIQCARWVRNIFDAESTQSSTGQTVGIIVPEFASYRSILKRELTAELMPSAVFPWLGVEPCFNISQGTPLALEPMISIALLIISIRDDAVPFVTFSAILGTPFLAGGQTESLARYSLEMKLRADNTVTVHLDRITEYRDRDQLPQLVALIRALQTQIQYNRSRKLPSAWAHDLTQFLKNLGWPGGDGSVYQKHVLESWRECLDEFASLDKILGDVPRTQATDILGQIVREKLFQIKTREHPIQVISLSEADGMQFDHLWIMGCHAEALPSPPSPNPFIPLHLQKKYDIPHSTAHRELQFAENILSRLIASSPDTIVSFPARNTHHELRMSPLLKTLAYSEFTSKLSHRVRDQLLYHPLEIWEDPAALTLAQGELNSLYGGYQILKNQADCPFRAFAKHRLHTQAFETPEIDFDHAERGSIVHKALEIFWSKIRTSAKLRQLKENGQLVSTLKDYVRVAIKDFHGKLIGQKQFTELEIQRVEYLLLDWLEKELLRPDFEVIHQEKTEEISIAGLDMKIRIDRIDRGANDCILLIDYKTGAIKPNDWFEDRLQDPQLPLYAIKMSPDAVAFAEIKKGNTGMGFKFIARDDMVMPGFEPINFTKKTGCPDWESLLTRWEAQLNSLGEEFISGKLEVNPVKTDETCKYCGLETLCRIEERKPFIRIEKEI